MSERLVITGLKFFNDSVEGKHYDSTTVVVSVDLDDSRGTARGKGTVEYKFGTHENYDKLAGIPLPFNADVEFKTVLSGKNTKVILTDVKPVPSLPMAAK